MIVPKLEREIGVEIYATRSAGVGGIIRQNMDDFVVEEMLVDGSKAKINRRQISVKHQALGSSATKERYLLCVMVKRNWDTFIAIGKIAWQLGISPSRIHIAGIKDTKAITGQHMTIEGISDEDVRRVQIKDVELRPLGYLRNKLSSYYLLGNNFHIAINNIHHSKSKIQKEFGKTAEELEGIGGAPNFYGHQRFGTVRPITHHVGRAIVQGDFKEAAMLFLAESFSSEHPDSRKARAELHETLDFRRAMKNFPRQLRYERLMLRRLVRDSDDFVGAFRVLPAKLQELFPQAYQSYLFNRFLSKRIASGLSIGKAEVGDYVVGVERSGLPMLTMNKTVNVGILNEVNEEIDVGKMRLAIPLIGFKQQVSLGAQGQIEKQIMEDEGVAPENFKIKSMPEISGRGELRSAVTPLNSHSLEEATVDTTDSSPNRVAVSFSLLRGSYATIVLREYMKPRNPLKAGF